MKTEIINMANSIYQLSQRGKPALAEFFENELGIPPLIAVKFAECYNPTNQPCELVQKNEAKKLESKAVFAALNLQVCGEWPKNQLAWHVIRHAYGEDVFDFVIKGSGQGRDNRILFPQYPTDKQGERIRLGLMSLGLANISDLPAQIIRKALMLEKYLGKEIGLELAKVLIRADLLFPPMREVNTVVEAIKNGLSGKEIIFVSLVCPDYEFKATGDPRVPYRYTFNDVHGGIGLVAQQVKRVIPYLTSFCRKFNIPYHLRVAIGDFEANSDDILKRVGKSKKQFVDLCRESLRAFGEGLPDEKMELILFEKEWGRKKLPAYIDEAYSSMLFHGNFGHIEKNTGKNPQKEVVEFIAKNEKNFYSSWHGRELATSELTEIIIRQGAEYAACGRIIAETFKDAPVIQIAGDRPKMQAFSSMYSAHPTLCAKRTY